MSDAFGLFRKGVTWSYRRYGPKGAVAFAVIAVVGYLVVRRAISNRVVGTDEEETQVAA